MQDAHDAFAVWLRKRLRQLGMTQADLAKMMDVDASTVSKWTKAPTGIKEVTRRKLAEKLGVALTDIPVSVNADPTAANPPTGPHSERTNVYTVADGIPDHCLIQLAEEIGLFRQFGVELVEISESEKHDLKTDYPARQQQLADLGPGDLPFFDFEFSLVSGQKDGLQLRLKPGKKSIEVATTNKYTGYALITSATKSVHSVYLEPTRKLEELRELFERLLERGVFGDNEHASRIACLGPLERKFTLWALGLYSELAGEELFSLPDLNSDKVHKLFGEDWSQISARTELLETLDDFGTRGRDIIVGDVLTLAVALANPKRYKVLLTNEDIQSVIREMNPYTNLNTLRRLKHLYKTTENADAIDGFKAAWKNWFDLLEQPVNWYLIYEDSVSSARLNKIVATLAKVADQVTHHVIQKREQALGQLLDIVKRHRVGLALTEDDAGSRLGLAGFMKACELGYQFKYAGPSDAVGTV